MKILTTERQLRYTIESAKHIRGEAGATLGVPGGGGGGGPVGPWIISISPNVWCPNFSEPVVITITGSRFTGASQVSFVAQGSVDSFVVDSDTQITVTTYLYGREGDPVDNMYVTAADGVTTSPITPATDFWYAAAWPEDAMQGAMAITPTRIWGINGTNWYVTKTASPPDRFMITTQIGWQGSGSANWPGSVGEAGLILQDTNYVYYISNNSACLTRFPINGDFASYDTLVIPAGCPPSGSANTYPGMMGVIYNNKMYLTWSPASGNNWNGVNDGVPRLLVIDLVAWSPTAFNIYTIPTAVPSTYGNGYIFSVCIANGLILVSMFTPSQYSGGAWNDYQGQIYYAPVSNPSTWSVINTSYRLGNGVAVGSFAYFLQNSFQNSTQYYAGIGYQRHLIIADCSTGTPVISYVDMSLDDANFKYIAQNTLHGRDPLPWASSTRLYVPANTITNSGDAYSVPYPPFYIAKRLLGTGAADGGGSTPPAIVDPQFSNVVFLDGFEGKNGAQWTLDESSFVSGGAYFTYYNSGAAAQISTAQKKFGTSSLHLKGTAGITWGQSNPNWDYGHGPFTVECWFYPTSSNWPQFLISRYDTLSSGSGFYGYWALRIDASGHLDWWMNNGSASGHVTATTTPSLNTWHHAAADFDGTTYRLYMDGATVATLPTSSFSADLTNSVLRLSIGGDTDSQLYYFTGYIDEARITKGVARYASSSGYTVPTSAFPRGPTPLPANGFHMKDLGLPWSWELWPNTGACFNGQLYVEFSGWDDNGWFAIVNEDGTSPVMYPVPTIAAPPANDLFANVQVVTLDTPTTGNVYYATGETNEQWPAVWDLTPGTSYPAYGSLVASYSSEALYGPEHTIWYEFTPPATGDYTITYRDVRNGYQFDITVWSGSALGSLTNLFQRQANYDTGTALLHLTAGLTYHVAFERYFYYGLYGTYGPDLEHDGAVQFTISAAPVPGACPAFVNAGSQATVSASAPATVTAPLPATLTPGNLLIAVGRIDVPLSSTGFPNGFTMTTSGWSELNVGKAMGQNIPSVLVYVRYVDGSSDTAPVFSIPTGGAVYPYNMTAQVFQYSGVQQFNIYSVVGDLYTGGFYSKFQSGSSGYVSDGGGVTPVRCPAAIQCYPYSTLINLTMYRPTETFTPSTPPGFTSRSITPNNWNWSDMQLGGDITGTIAPITLPENPTAWSCGLLELRSQ